MGLFSKKQSIDPVEFLVLRNELVELKERLDASEQAKASLEDRLSSLAATTMVLSSNSKTDTAEIVEKIESLENRLENTLAVGSKVDELHQRVIDVEQGGAGTGGPELEPRLAALSSRIDQVAELAAAPVAPDDELAGRLDQLSRSAETVDLLQRQISQINARMSAQADIADQVTALSDRIGLLQQRNVDSDGINQRLDELTAAGSTQELSERLALLGQRVAATEAAGRAAAEQAATRAEIAEQLAVLEARIAETSQQASKVDDIDERINSLVSSSPATEQLEARLAEVDAQLQAQAGIAERLGELDRQLQEQTAIAERVADIDRQLQEQTAIAERVASIDGQLQEQTAIAERVADIDARLAQIDGQSNDVSSLREIVELRSADVAGLRELIDVRSAEIAEVRAQLDQVQTNGVPTPAADGGLPSPQISQQLGELAERVAMTAEEARAGRERANALSERIDQLSATPPTVPDDVARRLDELAARVDAASAINAEPTLSDDVRQRLDELAERLASADEAARQARDQATSLDQRISGLDVGALDDQLAQLWARVDASAEQARLANEQAATLAQQLSDTGSHSGEVDQRLGEFAARLDAQGQVDQQIAEIWDRLVGAEDQARNAQSHAATLEQRLAETSSTVSTFAAASSQANTDEIDRQLDELRERLDHQASLPDRLADLDRRLAEMPDRGGDIQQLQERINELAASVPDTGSFSAQLAELSQRVSTSEGDASAALAQANALDERIQSVSTQLANQLGELSRDMDSLATRQPSAAAAVQVDDEAMQTLRSGQVKLATEQARYEISFREDLAMLAEQVRLLRGRG